MGTSIRWGFTFWLRLVRVGLAFFFFISLPAFAQQSEHGFPLDRKQRLAAIAGEEQPGEFVRTVKPHSGGRTNAFGPGFLLMESQWDYGSHGGVPTNLWDYGDGTMAVARTAATQAGPGYADRGTYFTYFEAGSWYYLPPSKVEVMRRGWGSISAMADGRSVVVSHTGNEVNVDALKGFAIWTSTITDYATSSPAIWPRLAVDGLDNIFFCSTLQGQQFGIAGRKEVAVSRDGGGSIWSHQILLPDTSMRIPQFLPDDQAMDSFGNKIAIAAAELGGDIHLWESLDNGFNWNYRNVTNYPLDIPIGAQEKRPFGICDLIYDNGGVLHIFWETVLATQDTAGTALELAFHRHAGIQHWSELDNITQVVAWADLPGASLESDEDLFRAGDPFNQVNANLALVGQPQAGVDFSGNLFLLFAALRPLDYDADSTHFTDLYAMRSNDGAAWGIPVNVTNTAQSEDLWASLADNIGDSLRFVYQSDDNTGNSVQGGGVGPTRILYYAFPTNALPPGNLQGRHLLVSPRAVNFGGVSIGDTSAFRAIVLYSAGTEAVTITEIVLNNAEFILSNPPATPIVLPPGNSALLEVAFASSISGLRSGTITLRSDDFGEPTVTVTLQAVGLPAEAVLFAVDDPRSAIAQVDPGSGAVLRKIPTPTPTGSGISGLAFDGASLFFTAGINRIYELNPETGEVRNSVSLPTGVTIDALAYTGHSLLAQTYRNRTIYELDPGSGQILNTITAAVTLQGGLTYAGARQSLFASTSTSEIVELDPITGAIMNRFRMPSGDFIIGLGYSNSMQTLFAGSSLTERLYALNPDNGNVINFFADVGTLSGLAADEFVLLSGPQLAVRPDSLGFGKVALGKTSLSRRVSLQNQGSENLIISGIAKTQAAFQLLDLPELPLTIAPRSLAAFNVTFTPERSEALRDTLAVSSNDLDAPVQHILLSGIGVKAPRPGTLFASTGRYDSLLTLDPATGQSLVVGATTGLGRVIEIEFREDGVLFGATDQGRIVTLDPVTGAPAAVGSQSFSGAVIAMEFDGAGRLYGAFSSFPGATSQLVTINPATGALSFIGFINFRDVGGLAFTPDGVLLGVTGGFSNNAELIRIDLLTGRGTLIGRTGFRDGAALEFDRSGFLLGGLGANDPSAGNLISINPTSGAGVLLGHSGASEITGLSFLPGFEVTMATVDTLISAPGDTVEVPVSLQFDLAALGAVGAALKATNGILAFVGFTPGPIVPAGAFQAFPVTSDSIHFGYANLGSGAITREGLLVTLRFVVAADAAFGATSLLKFSNLSAADAEGSSLTTGGMNGLLRVEKFVVVAGNAQYCRTAGNAGPPIPVPNLTARLRQNGTVRRNTVTDAAGDFSLENVEVGPDYRLEVERASGGIASAIHVNDALLAFRAFLGLETLAGCQSLAADVDGNLVVQPRDALMIFDFYLGKLHAFPTGAWRAFPASYDIDADRSAWKIAPEALSYPILSNDLSEQDFFAVARGDVDLSWEDSLLAKISADAATSSTTLRLAINSAPLAPGAKTVSWQVALESFEAMPDLFAFGAELRYNATGMQITKVRWGSIIPAEGFELDHNILPGVAGVALASDMKSEKSESRLVFGGFATGAVAIRQAGVLLEVEAQLQSELALGAQLPLRLFNAAVSARAHSTDRASFVAIKLAVLDGAVATAAQPTEYALASNYPNPFSLDNGANTQIRYQLPEAALVKLAIFNTLGQKVRELVSGEQQPAGYYTVAWDGRDAANIAVANGIYFFKLEAISAARRFTKSHKMLVVK